MTAFAFKYRLHITGPIHTARQPVGWMPCFRRVFAQPPSTRMRRGLHERFSSSTAECLIT